MIAGWLRSAPGRAWIAAGAPIVALLAVVTLLAVTALGQFARDQDTAFVQSSRQLVHGAVDAKEAALANLALDYANWNEAYRAVTVRWDQRWIESNYYSSVFDALVVFRADGTVRYVWTADNQPFTPETIGALVVDAARRIPNLAQLPRAATRQTLKAHTVALFRGQPVLIGVAPVSLEDDAQRLRSAVSRPTDYVATISFFADSEVSEIGSSLALQDFRFGTRAVLTGDDVQSPLSGPDGRAAGDFIWTNARPGSAALQRQIWLVLGLFFISGAGAIFVTHLLVRRNAAMMAESEAASRSSRMKSEFISIMSQELLAPVNTIIGFAELIEEETIENGDAGMRSDVRNILVAARRLARLAEEVLDQSRIESGRLKLNLEPVFVADVLAELEELVRERAEANHNTLRVTIEPDVGLLLADAFRLQQCLLNIVDNALKFTKDGAIELRARLTMRAAERVVAIEIADSGIGLSQTEIDRLFAPFSQANATISKDYGGAGLGLSITRQLARAMGGDVTVASAPGKGSTFTLTLRAISDQRAAA